MGELVIPVDEALDESEKPGWLVDGQQRSAAIRDADLAEFPVAAVAFIASGPEEQRSQFILVNNTKPLPKGLIHELLPDTVGQLPIQYARKQLPATLMIRLNNDRGTLMDNDSPSLGCRHTYDAGRVHQGQQRPQDDRELALRGRPLPVPRSA